MKNYFTQFFVLLWSVMFAVLLVFPAQAGAQATCPLPAKQPQNDAERCACFKDQFKISDGQQGQQINISTGQPFFCSASDLILTGIDYLLILSGTVTVLFIVIGGFWY